MSGGSYDYIYSKVNDIADEIRLINPEREAFVKHLRKVAKALHDIEWVDSCDYGKEGEIEAIMKCITSKDVLEIAVEKAIKASDDLNRAIKKASER